MQCGLLNLNALHKCALPGFIFEVFNFISRVNHVYNSRLRFTDANQRANIEIDYLSLYEEQLFGALRNGT